MAVDLRVSVRREIGQLKRNISRLTAQLESLKKELKWHERIFGLLARNSGRRGPKRDGSKRVGRINWDSVLKGLPGNFTLDQVNRRRSAGKKPRAYLRQVIGRWAKEGKVKRTGRGRYRKS
jgi:hypothetical protein